MERIRRAGTGLALGAVLALVLGACSSTAPPTLDAGAAPSAPGTTARPARGSGSTVAASAGTAPEGTAPGAIGPTTTGDVVTTVAPAADTPAVSTTAGPGGVTTTTPGAPGPAVTTTRPTAPTTTAAPTTTTAPPPGLSVTGPDGSSSTVHCMGAATTAQASVKWASTNSRDVAVALGNVADAFASPYNTTPLPLVGSYPVPVSCNVTTAQSVTVTAVGPGGKTTKTLTWDLHHM